MDSIGPVVRARLLPQQYLRIVGAMILLVMSSSCRKIVLQISAYRLESINNSPIRSRHDRRCRYHCRSSTIVNANPSSLTTTLSSSSSSSSSDCHHQYYPPTVLEDRRGALVKLTLLLVPATTTTTLFLTTLSPASVAAADDLSLAKPMSPSTSVEYLLPAARVRMYVYQLVSMIEDIDRLQQQQDKAEISTVDDPMIGNRNGLSTKKSESVAQLDALLVSSPPTFITQKDPTVTRNNKDSGSGGGNNYGKFGDIPFVGELGVLQQKQQERREQHIEVGVASWFEFGNLVGERRQWQQLQRAEQQRENNNTIRKALNIYTTNLNFSTTTYAWLGSNDEKRQRIRNDNLPTPTEVIRSELDARDLYRNQLQTAMDDLVAEWSYQRRQNNTTSTIDTVELLTIVHQAQTAIDKWFGFIPEQEVQLALTMIQREQQQQ